MIRMRRVSDARAAYLIAKTGVENPDLLSSEEISHLANAYLCMRRSKSDGTYSNESVGRAIKMREDGASLREIVSVLGGSSGGWSRNLSKIGLPARVQIEWPDDRVLEVAKLYRAWMPVKDIAERFGVTGSSIRNLVKRNGLKRQKASALLSGAGVSRFEVVEADG